MPDLLVNLLKLPSFDPLSFEVNHVNVMVRRAQPFEITQVLEFIESEFSVGWADEISVGFANKPVSVYIAIADYQVVGFAGYECTRRGFFGPVSYTHLRAHETPEHLVCRLLLEK